MSKQSQESEPYVTELSGKNDLPEDGIPFWKEARLQAVVDLDKWELNDVVLGDISARR